MSRIARFLLVLLVANPLLACDFCPVMQPTFSDDLKNQDAIVLARLEKLPKLPANLSDDLPKAKFIIETVVKGKEFLKPQSEITTLAPDSGKIGQLFLLMGVDKTNVAWGRPSAVSNRVLVYLTKIASLPKEGSPRLEFYQRFLEDEDKLLSQDAYNEFAKAKYADVRDLKPKMSRTDLATWLQRPNLENHKLRLYLMMLGVCGTEQDVPLLERFLRSSDPKIKEAMDALVASYLAVRGPDGLPVVEELFLRNKEASFRDTSAAVRAIRFHGTETDRIPRARLAAALHPVLDRPNLADQVIPDLARWEDWSPMDKLVEMFKELGEQNGLIRTRVVLYLRACPLPAARQHLTELEKIDSAAVQGAALLFPSAAPKKPIK